MPRHRLHNQSHKPGEHRRGKQRTNDPQKELPANNQAPKINILLLLLTLIARSSEQPTLLRLIELARRRRQCRSVKVLQRPATLIIRRRVGMRDLQRTSPRIPAIHAHLHKYLKISVVLHSSPDLSALVLKGDNFSYQSWT